MTPTSAAGARQPAPPRHAARATRPAGRRTRSALLDAAGRLFAERGLAGVSAQEIAAAADAFPSQVTYYFGGKEALFVEAASREALHLAARVEEAGAAPALDRSAYAAAMARVALASPALLLFAEAMLLARARPDLAPLVARTLDRLHAEGARAVTERCVSAGWWPSASPAATARSFWATCLGLVLELAGSGRALDMPAAEAAVLAALGLTDRPAHPSAQEA